MTPRMKVCPECEPLMHPAPLHEAAVSIYAAKRRMAGCSSERAAGHMVA